MMKTIQYLGFAALAFLTWACSEEENNTVMVSPVAEFQEENPLPQFLSANEFEANGNRTAYIDDNNNYEMGFSFKPLVKGQINSIVVMMPQPNVDVRVTIWDKEDASVIRTEYVDVLAANAFETTAVDPLELEANKEYFITMNANDYYLCNRMYAPNVIEYPQVYGNISITGSRCEFGNVGQVMPQDDMVNATAGFCSFNFLETE